MLERCVIDSKGFYITWVPINMQKVDGILRETNYVYDMMEGDALIDAPTPIDMVKPRWNGTEWIEAATDAEIEATKSELIPYIPSMDDRLQAIEQAILTLMMGES